MRAFTSSFAALLFFACGNSATSQPDATATPDSQNVDGATTDGPVGSPQRLAIEGRILKDAAGNVVRLHGVNLRDNLVGRSPSEERNPDNCLITCPPNDSACKQTTGAIITATEADTLASTLSLNFVRLRISFEGINRNDCDPDGTNLSPDLRRQLDEAVNLLAARQVWMLIEMRTADTVANEPGLYTPGQPDFVAYQKAWTYLAKRYANVDYIAGYGLLAEPSPDKAFPAGEVVDKLTGFQHAMMDAVHAQDPKTPFFIGPAFNYDTMGYRWDAYKTAFPEYAGRIIYEVNLLTPKTWIKFGKNDDPANNPAAVDVAYPVTPAATPAQLTATLLEPISNFTRPRDDERIFSKRSDLNFPMLMSKNYFAWYLGFAQAFAERHQVPMVVDQFGATSLAIERGQLQYEQDVIDAAEAAGMGWCRWIYASGDDRDVFDDPRITNFYAARGAERAGP